MAHGSWLMAFLRYYKSKTPQCPGWDTDILKWCLEEARANGLKTHNYLGGFILDEMKVQVSNVTIQ